MIVLGVHVTWAIAAMVLATYVIPYVSQLVTKKNGWWTGLVTLVLSAADAFFGLWAQQGSAFKPQEALVATIALSVTAWLQHKQHIDATKVQDWLKAHGNSLTGKANDPVG